MTKKRRLWKRKAKRALRGNYGIMIMAMAMTTMANMAASSVTNYFFSGSGTFTLVLSEIFSFVVSLVLNILAAGYAYMNLKVARGEETRLGDILYFFRNGSDRVIIAGFVISILQFLASLPMLIYNYTATVENTQEAILLYQSRLLILMLSTLVIQMILTIPFALSYYLLIDDPEMTGMEAVKGSLRMMRHHYLEYLILEVTFLPLILASVLTFYIALIWVLPYMNMVETEFYRALHGEIAEYYD